MPFWAVKSPFTCERANNNKVVKQESFLLLFQIAVIYKEAFVVTFYKLDSYKLLLNSLVDFCC